MGKKPLVGLVGLCWFGLALSGCKSDKSDCDCGKDTRAVRTTPRQGWNHDASSVVNRPRSVPDNSPIAGRGGDPSQMAHPYGNIDPTQYDVTPRDMPLGGQEPAGVPVGQPAMTQPAMRGVDMPTTMRTSQPPAEMPMDVGPARQPAGAAPSPVHEVPAPDMKPEMTPPVSGGAPAVQPAPGSPMSGAPTSAEPTKGSMPPVAIPVPPPGAAATPVPPPVETPSLPVTSGPISAPPPLSSAGPAVESAPKSVESSGLPLAPPPGPPPAPPMPDKK